MATCWLIYGTTRVYVWVWRVRNEWQSDAAEGMAVVWRVQMEWQARVGAYGSTVDERVFTFKKGRVTHRPHHRHRRPRVRAARPRDRRVLAHPAHGAARGRDLVMDVVSRQDLVSQRREGNRRGGSRSRSATSRGQRPRSRCSPRRGSPSSRGSASSTPASGSTSSSSRAATRTSARRRCCNVNFTATQNVR